MQDAIENYNIIDYFILHSSFTCDCEHKSFIFFIYYLFYVSIVIGGVL